MVAKLISGKSIRGVLSYNEQKMKEDQAKLIMASNFVRTKDDLSFKAKLDRFKSVMKKNPRAKTNAIHISLNFDPSENPDESTLCLIANEYMERIDFGNQPYLVYQHFDAAHPHIHIITTNIQEDGKRIDIHNLGKTKSEQARKEIEFTYGLVRAESKSQKKSQTIKPIQPDYAAYGKTETKRAITNVVSAVTRSYKFTSLAELNAVLQHYGVIADGGREGTQMYKKKGLVYSIIDKKGQKVGVPIKSSSIYGKPTLANLEKRFVKNKELRKHYRVGLKKAVDKVLDSKAPLIKTGFKRELQKSRIEVLFRENKEGLTYGTTFIDHNRKVVFNGSALGKAYSVNALMKHFSPSQNEGEVVRRQSIRSNALEDDQKYKDSYENPRQDGLTHKAKGMIDGVIVSSEEEDNTPWQLRKKRKKKKRGKKKL